MKIMIVEESYLFQKQLKEILTAVDEKINVKHAYSYTEALDLFPHEMPENVLIDTALSDGSSLVLLQKFKNLKPETKVILMVNFPPGQFINKCIAMGADDFFEKSNLYCLLHHSSNNKVAVNKKRHEIYST
jgi:DNA-binding NarL/FixJ family response regulator